MVLIFQARPQQSIYTVGSPLLGGSGGGAGGSPGQGGGYTGFGQGGAYTGGGGGSQGLGLGGGWSVGQIPGISGSHPGGYPGSYPSAVGVNYGNGNYKIGGGGGADGYVGFGLELDIGHKDNKKKDALTEEW